jgi:hypothetical protein
MAGRSPTPWEQKGVAVAGYTAAVIRKHNVVIGNSEPHTDQHIVGVSSNRLSLLFSDVMGLVKVGTLLL